MKVWRAKTTAMKMWRAKAKGCEVISPRVKGKSGVSHMITTPVTCGGRVSTVT